MRSLSRAAVSVTAPGRYRSNKPEYKGRADLV
jgi:hypothetical protein